MNSFKKTVLQVLLETEMDLASSEWEGQPFAWGRRKVQSVRLWLALRWSEPGRYIKYQNGSIVDTWKGCVHRAFENLNGVCDDCKASYDEIRAKSGEDAVK